MQEEKLRKLVCNKDIQQHFRTWIDSTLQDIETEHATSERLLSELQETVRADEGGYWNAKTISQHCNVSLDEKRLRRLAAAAVGPTAATDDEHASWPELIRLKATLHALQTRATAARAPEQVDFLHRVEEELRIARFTPRELSNIAYSLEVKLGGDVETQAAVADITLRQQLLTSKLPLIDDAENELEAALMNGDMALAEAVSYKQLDFHEEVLALVLQQYPVLTRLHDDSEEFKRRRRWAIFRLANKDIRCVVEGKFRVIEACLDDMRKITEQVENYTRDDTYQRKRYDTDLEQSHTFLQDNYEQQQAVWNRIMELYGELVQCQSELGTLADARKVEIKRRLDVEEREASRRAGHDAFLKQAEAFRNLLDGAKETATRAASCAKALNDFVLDGCETITAKFDRQHEQLHNMLHALQNTHFKRFCDFYLSAGRLRYRLDRRLENHDGHIEDLKAKLHLASETLDPHAMRYAEERDAVLAQRRDTIEALNSLNHRVTMQERDAESLLRAFTNRGVPFVHPRDIVEKVNFDRRERILDYREIRRPQLSTWEASLQDEWRACEAQQLDKDRKSEQRKELQMKKPRLPTGASPSTIAQFNRTKALLDVPTMNSRDSTALSATTTLAMGGSTTLTEALTKQSQASLSAGAGQLKKGPVSGSAPPLSASALGTTTSNTSGGLSSSTVTYAKLCPGAVVKALFDYRPQDTDELALSKGETIVCVAPAEEGWYKGVSNMKTGIFPVNYVQVVGE